MICKKCGCAIDDGDVFCRKCGENQIVLNDTIQNDTDDIPSSSESCCCNAESGVAVEQTDKQSIAGKAKHKITVVSIIIAVVLIIAIALSLILPKVFKGLNDDALIANIKKVTISAGCDHTVGLKSDGTVMATVGLESYETVVGAAGGYDFGQCDVQNWRDIAAISADSNHTVGLKSDGTVVAVGYNENGECDVQDWTDIIAISAGCHHTVGLKSDGTVVAVGWNTNGECDVQDWTDIIAISAGDGTTIGLKSDGSVVAVGYNGSGRCDVQDWTDIIAISAGHSTTIGLKSDGTVVATGFNKQGQCDVQDWHDIVAISAGLMHSVGLKSDGTVVAVGDNSYGQCKIKEWKGIVDVSAGFYHTVGLKSDGTVVAAGDGSYGRCTVQNWTDIMLPQQNVLIESDTDLSSTSDTAESTVPKEDKAKEAYEAILNEYREACAMEDFDEEALPQLYPNVNETMIQYYHIYDQTDGFNYCYIDINNDGIDELFIGNGTSIIDLYLFDGKQAVKAIDNDTLGDRSRLTLYTDGTLYEQGSNGASAGSVALYKVNDKGTGLEEIFAYDYEYIENNAQYYNENETISEDEFLKLINDKTEETSFSWEELN